MVRPWRCQAVSARGVALALLPGQRLHPGARHGLPYCCFADRLLRQVHGHRAIEDVKGQVCLAAHHRADRSLQYGDLLGAVQATNFKGHAVHRVCSFASLIHRVSVLLLYARETSTHHRSRAASPLGRRMARAQPGGGVWNTDTHAPSTTWGNTPCLTIVCGLLSLSRRIICVPCRAYGRMSCPPRHDNPPCPRPSPQLSALCTLSHLSP
jgi:hypothetical protein